MKLNLPEILGHADELYMQADQKRRTGRLATSGPGIRSEQVRAAIVAIVEAINDSAPRKRRAK